MSQKYWTKKKAVAFWMCRGRNTLHHTASPAKTINQSSLLKGGEQGKFPNARCQEERGRGYQNTCPPCWVEICRDVLKR